MRVKSLLVIFILFASLLFSSPASAHSISNEFYQAVVLRQPLQVQQLFRQQNLLLTCKSVAQSLSPILMRVPFQHKNYISGKALSEAKALAQQMQIYQAVEEFCHESINLD